MRHYDESSLSTEQLRAEVRMTKELNRSANGAREIPVPSWDDQWSSLSGAGLSNPGGRINADYGEGTFDFDTNATSSDFLVQSIQASHRALPGTDVRPHIHWFQEEDDDPAWRLDYRIFGNGDSVPAWITGISPSTARVFPYVSGTLMQITSFPAITGLGDLGPSFTMDLKIYRVGASDTYSVPAKLKFFDPHVQFNSIGGSGAEFIR